MRVKVGAVRAASGLILTVVAVCAVSPGGAMVFANACSSDMGGVAVRFAEGYGLTLLSFATFPRTRRGDLAKLAGLAGFVLAFLQLMMGNGGALLSGLGWMMGILAVVTPSYLGRYRSAMRAAPNEPFSTAYRGDRRAPLSTAIFRSKSTLYPSE